MTDMAQRWTDAMRAGDHDTAFALADAALAARDRATRDDPARPYHERWVWDGRAPDGEDVLVRCYHGLGDTIQFARFLPLLARRARQVTVEAPARLVPLLATVAAGIAFVPFDVVAPLPPAPVTLEIGELPHVLRAAPGEAPARYLSAAPAALPPGTIGLCHASGAWDAARDLLPGLLRGIAALGPAVTLASRPVDLPVLNPAGCPFDMADTAALVAACDLVVTVDTMIAHLAGALGRPTWLLLKSAPDWRWDPARIDTPWYPATRLYVQPRAGDWASVVARVERDLRTRVQARSGRGASQR